MNRNDSSDVPEEEKYEIVNSESTRASSSARNFNKKSKAPVLPMPSHPTESSDSTPLPQRVSRPESSRQNQFDLNFDTGNKVIETVIDIDDRDELNINKALNAPFSEIYAEPGPDYHSIACVWTNSFRVFQITRVYCYKALSLILGIPLAFIFGLIFACTVFFAVWIGRPIMRLTRMALAQVFQLTALIAIYAVRPFFYAMGACFSSARVHYSSGEPITEPWYPEEKP